MLGRMANYAETIPSAPRTRAVFFQSLAHRRVLRGYHSNELAPRLQARRAQCGLLLFPRVLDSEPELELIRHMDSYRAISDKWSNMQLAVVSISNYPSYPDLGVEYRFGSELTRQKAVGRVLAHYFNIDGTIIDPVVDNVMQSSIDQLRATDAVIAVCSSLLRPESVVGRRAARIAEHIVLPRSLAGSC